MTIESLHLFLREFFGWCTILNLILLIFTAVMSMLARGLIERVHGKLFGLSPEAINATIYAFLGMYKIFFIVLCLVPWLALVIMG